MTQCQTVNTVDETERKFRDLFTMVGLSKTTKNLISYSLFQFRKSNKMYHENESQNCDM
jgi:hypothetical protein